MTRPTIWSPWVGAFGALLAGVSCGAHVVGGHGGGGGSGGNASDSSAASQSSGTTTQPPSHYGTPAGACSLNDTAQCYQWFGADASTSKDFEKTCKEKSGTLASECASAGVIGCCAVHLPGGGLEEICSYGGGETTSKFKKTCASEKGTFTSTP